MMNYVEARSQPRPEVRDATNYVLLIITQSWSNLLYCCLVKYSKTKNRIICVFNLIYNLRVHLGTILCVNLM